MRVICQVNVMLLYSDYQYWYLVLHACTGYIKIFIKKGLGKKPDLGIHYQRSKLIHDPRSRPKDAQSHKIILKYSYLVMGGKYLQLN